MSKAINTYPTNLETPVKEAINREFENINYKPVYDCKTFFPRKNNGNLMLTYFGGPEKSLKLF